jgi:L-cysteine desulfidase
MRMSEYLSAEWRPALGCTEPAAVAHAIALAAAQVPGEVQSVSLRCDARTYKNCYAVGIPNSGQRSGLRWAMAIGASLPGPELGLECFSATTEGILSRAQLLVDGNHLTVEVMPDKVDLLIDCTVTASSGTGRAVMAEDHTHLVHLERDGQVLFHEATSIGRKEDQSPRDWAASHPVPELMALARSISLPDRDRLREGAAFNIAMAKHGLDLLPEGLSASDSGDLRFRLARWVSAGVFARMSGEPLTVMSLAGSGNKGITVSVPLVLWGRESGYPEDRIDEALALACLLTSVTTHHLGTLSAVCGGANASGIGLASALVMLQGGTPEQVSLAIATMVGNVAGMVCDGAKIGCAMKTMTGVQAAFQASSLALVGVGVPPTDGIVGDDAEGSLRNLGRLARLGMAEVDRHVLQIMQDKLRPVGSENQNNDI